MARTTLVEPIHVRKTARVEPDGFSEIQLGRMPANMRIEGSLKEMNSEPFDFLLVNEENYLRITGKKKRFERIGAGVDEGAYTIDLDIRTPDNYFLLLGTPSSACARTSARTVMVDLEICEDHGQGDDLQTFTIPQVAPRTVREARKVTSESDKIRTAIELQPGEYESIPLGQLGQHDSIKGTLTEDEDEVFDYMILDEKNHRDYVSGEAEDYIKPLDKGVRESRYAINRSIDLTDNYILVVVSDALAYPRTVQIDLAITRHRR